MSSQGYDQFLDLMLTSFDHVFSSVRSTHSRELNAAITNDLFNLTGPRQIARVASENEELWWHVWYSFIEIQSSYDALIDFEVYIRRYPYGGTRVSRVRHLLHVIEAYLHEVYLLTERLKAFPGSLAKLLKGDTRQPAALALTRELSKSVNKSFKGLTAARGRHTHNERFDSNEFHRLRVLEGFLTAGKKVSWTDKAKLMFDSSYRDMRNRWTRTIADNNTKTHEFLDQYCDALRPLIFQDGRFAIKAKHGAPS